ncbi:MAG: thiamine phosphate synthase [Kofleriaceae bacterium]
MVDPELLARGDRAALARAFGAAVQRIAVPGVVVQVREKDLEGGPLLDLVRATLATGARVVVNDRLDVALAAGAHGVHLPERGLAIADARRLIERAGRTDFELGTSCHTLDGVRAARDAGAQMIQLGPIWATPNKGAPLGAAALAEARALLGAEARLVAVGGIDRDERARVVLCAGADAVAAIRAIWDGSLGVATLAMLPAADA